MAKQALLFILVCTFTFGCILYWEKFGISKIRFSADISTHQSETPTGDRRISSSFTHMNSDNLTTNTENKRDSTKDSASDKAVKKDLRKDTVANYKTARYLLPIEYYNSGPNYLYRNFRIAAIVAMYQNRSIVEISFPRHHSQGRGLETDLRMFNSTFDVDQLHKVLHTISLENFKRECNNTVNAVMMSMSSANSSDRLENYEMHRLIYRKLYGIDLPIISKDEKRRIVHDDTYGVGPHNEQMKCLGMFHMLAYPHATIPEINNISAKIDRYLQRSKGIRDVAEAAMDRMCDGKPYLAIHWRNKSGEGCRSRCDKIPLMVQTNENAVNVVRDIRMLLHQYNLSCTYVAYPPYAALFMKNLKRSKIPNLFDNEYLMSDKHHELDIYKRDDYMLSLLEQEICRQSDVFLGWKQSSWTSFLSMGRTAAHTGSLTINLQDLPSWKPEKK
ncbi:uncharacterized protein LOC144435493 [Glandiceps talaboti]